MTELGLELGSTQLLVSFLSHSADLAPSPTFLVTRVYLQQGSVRLRGAYLSGRVSDSHSFSSQS